MSNSVWGTGNDITPVTRVTEPYTATFLSDHGPSFFIGTLHAPKKEEIFVDLDGLPQFVDENFGYSPDTKTITFSSPLPTGLIVHIRVLASSVINLPDQLADPSVVGNEFITQESVEDMRNFLHLGTAATKDVGVVSGVAEYAHTHTGEYEPVINVSSPYDGKFISASKLAKFVPSYITGLLYGGELSATLGTSVFSIAACDLQYVDDYSDRANPVLVMRSLATQSNISDAYPSSPQTYIGINSGGQLVQQSVAFTSDDLRTIVQIGVIAKSGGVIIALAQLSQLAYNGGQLAGDLTRAIGAIVSGCTYSGNANLTFARTAGDIFRQGAGYIADKRTPNDVQLTAQNPVSFAIYARNSSNTVFTSSAILTTLNPAVYDNGGASVNGIPTGVVSTNSWQAIRLYLSSNGNTLAQYGTAVYNSLSAARDGVASETFYQAPITKLLPFRGYLFVRGGATSLSSAGDALFLGAGKFGDTGLTPSTGPFDGNLSADLVLNGANRKITGDFTSATQVVLQTNVANSNSYIRAVPNGSGSASQFTAHGSYDIANSQFGTFQCYAGSAVKLISNYAGTPASGTYLPLILTAGGADRATLYASGAWEVKSTVAGNTLWSSCVNSSLTASATAGFIASATNSARSALENYSIYGGEGCLNIVNPSTAVGTIYIWTGASYYLLSTTGFTPSTDNARTLGGASNRFSTLFAGTGTINTSDARDKTTVRAFSANEIMAAKLLAKEIGFYRFLASIAEKGETAARIHCGMTVQRAIEVMESCSLDPMEYGFICYDEWAETVTKKPIIETGEDEQPVTTYEEIINPAGSKYSFRMDELAMFIIRGMEARLSALEEA